MRGVFPVGLAFASVPLRGTEGARSKQPRRGTTVLPERRETYPSAR
nr:hypothetical protein [uncultured Porphyromonas sp.]